MGKGDKKSKRGKLVNGSYGNSRKKKAIKAHIKRSTTGKGSQSADSEAGKTSKKVSRKQAEA